MTSQDAFEMREHGLRAIEHLSALVTIAKERCSTEEFEILRSGVAASLGKIQLEILQVIYARYPDLNHLKEDLIT